MKEAKQKFRRHWLAVSIILLTGLVFMASPSYAADRSAEQSGQIATVEHMLQETQDSIWQQLHSQEVDDLAQQLRAAEKAGRDDEAGQLRRQLEQLEERLLGNAPPAESELAWLVRKKQMLLDELARLGGETQEAVSSAVAAAVLPAGTSSISGTVTDSAGPVAGANVRVVDSSGNEESATTDADGVYAVANIAAGTYYVEFSADGYASEWHEDAPQQECATPVTLAAGESKTGINALFATPGGISGKVTGPDGNAVSGAYVYAYGQEYLYDAYASTAADGTYTISGLPSGSYKVEFEAPYSGTGSDLLDEWYDDKADYSSADAVAVTAQNTTSGINAQLEKGGSITGTVKDGSNGDALLANVYVYAYFCDDASCDFLDYLAGYANTSADGTYTISGLLSGSYKVLFNAPDGSGLSDEWYNGKAASSSADVVAVTVPNVKTGIDATLAKGGSITGTVKDGSNSDAPLENASVAAYLCDNASCDSWSYSGYSSGTSTDGTYTISGLPSGSYKVRFYGPSSGTGWFTTDFISEWYNDKADGSNADVVAVTAPDTKSGIDATMVKGGIITGTVTDSDGNPVEGVDVSVAKPDVSGSLMWVYTDANGKYTLSGLAAGGYKMYFRPRSNSSNSLPEWYNGKPGGYSTGFSSADVIAVTLGATQTINAQLEKGGSISGAVTNDGAAFKCANVSVYDAAGSYDWYDGSAVTDYQGKYTVKGLFTGSYKVLIEGDDRNTGDRLQQWYESKEEYSCADTVAVTESAITSNINAAFPVQLQPCADNGSISGKVAASNNSGISGVTVKVYDSSTGTLTGSGSTGADGAYTVNGLPAGSYKVEFVPSSASYISEWYNDKADKASADAVTVTAQNTTANINAVLAAVQTVGSISGKVTASNDSGLSGVAVKVYDSSTGTLTGSGSTGADGAYTVGGLPAGSYKVEFAPSSASYIGEWYNDKADKASADAVTVTAQNTTANINAVLAAVLTVGSISGKVTDINGSGISGVVVNVYESSSDALTGNVSTGANGSYTVSSLPSGSYKVEFAPSSVSYIGEWYNDKADKDSADAVTVTAQNTTANIDAVLAATPEDAGSISGKVTDSNNSGLSSVSVKVYASGTGALTRSGSTGTDGAYTVSGLPASSYKVEFAPSSASYIGEWYNDKADKDSADTVTVTAQNTTANINAVLAAAQTAGSISGKVTDSAGSGLSGVAVKVYDSGTGALTGSGSTGADGAYTVSGLPASSYKVEFAPSSASHIGEWYNDKADKDSADAVNVTAQNTTADINAVLAAAQNTGSGNAALRAIIHLLL